MSVAATAIVTAIAVLAVQLGFTKIQEARGFDGSLTVTALNKAGNKVTLVKLDNPALGSPQYDLVNLSTTATKKDPDAPIYKIVNDSATDKRIFSLAFIPLNSNTKDKAILEIRLNGRRLFPITDGVAGMLKGVTSLNIPIPPNFGLKIKQDDRLAVFLHNGTDGTSISITFSVFIANMQ